MHDVLQPAKHEDGDSGPIMHRFPPPPQPTGESAPPAAADEPGAVVDSQGNVYMEGDG
jgi:hypothetical protein